MRTTVSKPALRFDAVREVTGLEWFAVQKRSELPRSPGVYCVVDEAGAVRYHGCGKGQDGLWSRVGTHLGNIAYHRNQIGLHRNSPDDRDVAYGVALQSPAIREMTEHDVQIWAAVAAPAPWALPGYSPGELPALAVQWEGAISALSHVVCGHRSHVGAGAWEGGDVVADMAPVVWDRLEDLGYGWSI